MVLPPAKRAKSFISEKSQQVKHIAHKIGDKPSVWLRLRLSSLIHPQDEPEVVQVKIREVSDKLAESGKHDRDTLREATAFLQDKWLELQQGIGRTSKRIQSALDSSWQKLTYK